MNFWQKLDMRSVVPNPAFCLISTKNHKTRTLTSVEAARLFMLGFSAYWGGGAVHDNLGLSASEKETCTFKERVWSVRRSTSVFSVVEAPFSKLQHNRKATASAPCNKCTLFLRDHCLRHQGSGNAGGTLAGDAVEGGVGHLEQMPRAVCQGAR